MAAVHDIRKATGRKLTKRRMPQRHTSVQFPERLKDGDDAQEDAAAAGGRTAQHMHQSVFSMIAAAGSKTNFHARFDEDSSDSDEDCDAALNSVEQEAVTSDETVISPGSRAGERPSTVVESDGLVEDSARFLPQLILRTEGEKNYMSKSTLLPTRRENLAAEGLKSATPRDAPVMGRMLEAQTQLRSASTSQETRDDDDDDAKSHDANQEETNDTILAVRLGEIFGFKEPEDVISEYPCWLMQSVLLQGYMYITRRHICFYAYMPKKTNVIAKSGYLSKRGKQNPKYSRYWFTLKGDVLSYYLDRSNLYFPSGNIDLQYGISATLSEHKDKDTTYFSVVTHQRTYHFMAESVASAKEWVKTLQKVIFRSHNDGDSVKISLPIANIIDVEQSPVIEFAETLKIRVIDSDETYAVDEYYFSFFSFGKDAYEVLHTMVDGSAAQQLPQVCLSPSRANSDVSRSRDSSHAPRRSMDARSSGQTGAVTPVLHEGVRATLVPVSPHISGHPSPRLSGDWSRNSMDVSRQSLDLTRDSFQQDHRSASTSRVSLRRKGRDDRIPSAPFSRAQGSSDSFVHSLEQGTESSLPFASENGTQASGSQILDRSDVFQSPTIQCVQPSSRFHGTDGRHLEDPDRTAAEPTAIQLQPPTRSQTKQSFSAKNPNAKIGHGRHAGQLQQSNSSPTLQQLVKAGAYPLQRAAGFAASLRNRSKRMSNLLASESMGYVEKVSGMWAGGRKHYGDEEEVKPEPGLETLEDEDDSTGHGDRFRGHFALPASEKLQATFFGFLHRVLPLYGKIYISNKKFCFRSLIPGSKTKIILPLKDIENVNKEKGFRFGYSGLVIVIGGHEELFFEFAQSEARDDCTVTILGSLEQLKYMHESGMLTEEEIAENDAAKAEHHMLQEARLLGHNEHDLKLPQSTDQTLHPQDAPPILFDDPGASILNFQPPKSLRITCLTIGSRGDVQPYIALCKGFLGEGHKPKIATHAEFEPWIRKHGIDFAPVEGDPAELMRICVENGMFTFSFLKEAHVKFRGWIDELLSSAWQACQNTDLLIESPSAMAGIHIAEALKVPYFRAFSMPWTRTRAYPHAFIVPEHKMGGAFNYFTYVMFDNVFWRSTAGQINRWRKRELGLRSTNLVTMQPNKVPFLYSFSPSVVVPPLDYSDWIRVTGYWFLDEASDYTPPEELTSFISKARTDGKKIVYVGFGSIVVDDPAAMTEAVVESVLKADVRCILSKGWSDRLGNKDAAIPEVPIPSEILQIGSAPHDWLFKQVDAVAHHGGSGTTGASLRAGLPTIIRPFFGDQHFFGSRVEDLGVGICIKIINVSLFARALWAATHSERMIIKARVLGEQIRKENGVGTAIQAIYRDLEYAKTLIKHRASASAEADDNGLGGDEESWTFIGDDDDSELARGLASWEPAMHPPKLDKGKAAAA